MARLADTNTKLDALITAMGGAPPVAGATLAEVLTVLQAIHTVLTDVHTDTISIDQKLLIVRDTLTDVHTDTISIDQKLLRIGNAVSPLDEALPSADKSSIVWSLYRLVDAVAPAWPGAPYTPIKQVLNQLYQMGLQIQPDVDSLQNALGLVTGDATTTVLGRLSAIEMSNRNIAESTGLLPVPEENTVLDYLKALKALGKCACNNGEPNSGDCSDAFDSRGMWLGPFGSLGGESVIVAVFDGILPDGLSYGSVFGITEDQTELICSDWSQWQVYVGSTDSQYAESPETLTRYRTNEWRQMDGSGSRAFSVSARAGILVTLCNVADFTPGSGNGGGPVPTPQCDFTVAVGGFAQAIGPNATVYAPGLQGGVYWVLGNDVDNGQAEIAVDSTVYATVNLVGAYGWTAIGMLPSGTLRVRHIGAGNADVRLFRCPDVPV